MTSVQTDQTNEVDPGVRELISSATRDVSTLLSAQVELAKAELKQTAVYAATASAMFVVAGVFAFLGFVFLLVTIAYVLVQLGLQVWAGFGIVTAFLLLVAIIVGFVGFRRVRKIKGPERTKIQVDETKKAIAHLKD